MQVRSVENSTHYKMFRCSAALQLGEGDDLDAHIYACCRKRKANGCLLVPVTTDDEFAFPLSLTTGLRSIVSFPGIKKVSPFLIA